MYQYCNNIGRLANYAINIVKNNYLQYYCNILFPRLEPDSGPKHRAHRKVPKCNPG